MNILRKCVESIIVLCKWENITMCFMWALFVFCSGGGVFYSEKKR